MKNISVYTVSLGCPKNLVDTENMLTQLRDYYTPASTLKEADIVLINTCAFIRPAVEESIEIILDIAHDTRGMPEKPLLVVSGCLLNRYQDELKLELPEVDLWVSYRQQASWLKLVADKLSSKYRSSPLYQVISSISESVEKNQPDHARVISTDPGYAYLKISEGCSHKCSFCLIPYLRGPQLSRPVQDIVSEAKTLLDQGVKELCLVAQDVLAYGRDLSHGFGLRELLAQLAKLPELHWLRLLYLHPSGMTSDFLRFLQEIGPKFLPYFDIPFQHINSEILSRMNRYPQDEPVEIVEKIREFFPQAALRTSLIVGYPGETESHFQQLIDFVQKAEFTHLGVFPFYPEEGTLSARQSVQIAEEQKMERQSVLMSVQKEISFNMLKSFRQTYQDVLIDKRHPEWPTLYKGRVWFQAPEIDGLTYISGHDLCPGELVSAQIVDSTEYDLQALTYG